MTLQLRDYQEEALASLTEAARRARAARRHNPDTPPYRVLAVQPTGAGKTILVLALAQEAARCWGWRTLIVVPTRALLRQTLARFRAHAPALSVSGYGDGLTDLSGQVVVATQAGLQENRLRRIPADAFSLLVCDEAHHVAATTYRALLEHFTGAALVVGLTATYIRGDAVTIAAEEYFPTVVVWHTLGQLVRAGYLVPLYGRYVFTETDLAGVTQAAGGEFITEDLARMVNTPARNEIAVRAWLTYQAGRPTVAFCVNIAHAQDLAAMFRAHGVPAAAVWGAMPRAAYAQALEDYRAGRVQVLVNAQMFIEGWDEPQTSGVLICRPATKASGAVLGPQMIGRATRLHPESGKQDGLIVELRDRPRVKGCNGSEKGTAASYLAGVSETPEDENNPSVPLHEQACQSRWQRAWQQRRQLLALLAQPATLEAGFDVLERIAQISAYTWVPLGEALFLPLSGDDFLEIAPETPLAWEARAYVADELSVLGAAPAQEGALRLADHWLERHCREAGPLLRQEATWRARAASEKQILYAHRLTGLPVSYLVGLRAGAVSDVIKSARALLVTPEQLAQRQKLKTGGPAYLPHAWQVRPTT